MKITFLVTVTVANGPYGPNEGQFACAHREAEQLARIQASREALAHYAQTTTRLPDSRPNEAVPAPPQLLSHSLLEKSNGEVVLTEIYELEV